MHIYFTHCANSIISSQNIDQKLIFVFKKSSRIFRKDKKYRVEKSVLIILIFKLLTVHLQYYLSLYTVIIK